MQVGVHGHIPDIIHRTQTWGLRWVFYFSSLSPPHCGIQFQFSLGCCLLSLHIMWPFGSAGQGETEHLDNIVLTISRGCYNHYLIHLHDPEIKLSTHENNQTKAMQFIQNPWMRLVKRSSPFLTFREGWSPAPDHLPSKKTKSSHRIIRLQGDFWIGIPCCSASPSGHFWYSGKRTQSMKNAVYFFFFLRL